MFHAAAFAGDPEVLTSCLFSLGSNDVYAILTAVPNAGGVTLQDLTVPELCRAKIQRIVQLGGLDEEAGREMMNQITAVPREVLDVVRGRIAEIQALAADTKGGAPIAPTFELARLAPRQPIPAAAARH